jgi:hypothetical protein
MTNKSAEVNKHIENQQMSAALTQMSDAELKQLLHSIEALQIELSRLTALLSGTEPIEVVTATQGLLKRLNDEIDRIFVIRQMKDSRSRLQEWDNEGGWVDHAPVIHLLRRVNGGKGCLMWTDIRRVQS